MTYKEIKLCLYNLIIEDNIDGILSLIHTLAANGWTEEDCHILTEHTYDQLESDGYIVDRSGTEKYKITRN